MRVSRSWLYTHLSATHHKKLEGRLLFNRKEIDAWISDHGKGGSRGPRCCRGYFRGRQSRRLPALHPHARDRGAGTRSPLDRDAGMAHAARSDEAGAGADEEGVVNIQERVCAARS